MRDYLRKLIPRNIFSFFQPAYHYILSALGAIIYSFPSKKLFVIGVTGTKGKSSTVELINAILEKAGLQTALTNTIHFKNPNSDVPNLFKMSMPGRFFMQKFLYDAVKAGATHAVIEITSEGARQFRNKFIDLDIAVFTNLAPEHIESHGSYEKYRDVKVGIIKEIEKSKKPGTAVVVNTDDAESGRFLNIHADDMLTYSFSDISAFHEDRSGIRFIYKKQLFTSKLLGKFNAYNILTAIKIGEYLGLSIDIVREAIMDYKEIKGRGEKIVCGQSFDVIVDYAHTPDSLTAIYEATNYAKRKICVLGNTGGGRDVWKRPEMAKIAENYCDHIILTNEDPYDEDPIKIVYDMKSSIKSKPCDIIMNRREAIAQAISLAHEHDVVIITGKGTDPYIMGPNGEKTPWSDAEVAREEIEKALKIK
jgi:UDP-N-acetylmuramoyl-L-alanyl-D-glutamate--2,6-diaminopimelate ligase